MYARNVTAHPAPDQLDAAIQLWKKVVAPSVKQQTRFIGARLQINRENGLVRSLGFWGVEADLHRSVQWNNEQVARFASFFTEPPIIEVFEVAAEA